MARACSFALAGASLLLAGCGALQLIGIGKPPPAPPAAPAAAPAPRAPPLPPPPPPLNEQPFTVTLLVRTSADLNPDGSGRASPVRLQAWLSEPASGIESQSFEALFGLDGGTLPAAPLATVTLRPGSERRVVLEATKERSRLTLAAGYRDPYSTQWLYSVKLSTLDALEVDVTLDATAIRIGQIR